MTFADQLRVAMDTPDPLAYISRVKAVVAERLSQLDNTAKIADTRYFNHSAVPDFVVSWPGERGERRIYLRDSYESIAASHDGLYLKDGDPVLLSLEQADDGLSQAARTQMDAEIDSRTLVTDSEAVEIISEYEPGQESPLTKMVRANFVRGARGHVDRPVAQALIETPAGDGPPSQLIADAFFEDAAFRIGRTAAIIERALAPVVDGVEDVQQSVSMSGTLSLFEVQTVLPWLLAQESAVRNESFWMEVAQMISFSDLEKIRDSLQQVDLTPLLAAARKDWVGKWGYIGVSVPMRGDETYELRRDYWSFDGGAVGRDIGSIRISVAHNGQLVPKTRSGRSSTQWSELSAAAESERVLKVDLHGLQRSVSISAEQSPDVRGDVQDVSESLEDTYYVSELSIRGAAPKRDSSETSLHINFETGIVSAPAEALIGDIVRATGKFLALNGEVDVESLWG